MKLLPLIAILDFGSQYTHLIARRCKELGYESRILPWHADIAELKAIKPKGIILSGGPASVYDNNAPACHQDVFNLHIPVLGICYGAHFMAQVLGGQVEPSGVREYGLAELNIKQPCRLFNGVPLASKVWMSHGDKIVKLPPGFATMAITADCGQAVMAAVDRDFYGVQFHPEVVHTQAGGRILDNFLGLVCGIPACKLPDNFITESVRQIRREVGSERVILGLSGGVDSSVAALLLAKALGENLICIFVDNGLLRKNEFQEVSQQYQQAYNLNLRPVQAGQRFLSALAGVTDPEEKRKVIGRVFVEVFQEEARRLPGVTFLAQGTIYPDRVESAGTSQAAAGIKSHHNVGGLPETLGLKLIEPLRELYKDQVRQLGLALGMSEDDVWRHPFPGPGLGVRIVGDITDEKVKILQEADAIVREEIDASGWRRWVWQAFAVLLPVRSVGVMGDARTYENAVVLRVVQSTDGMTADWAHLPPELIGRISRRITNQVRGVNRVVYDVSSKPPATIEWE